MEKNKTVCNLEQTKPQGINILLSKNKTQSDDRRSDGKRIDDRRKIF